MSNQRLAMTSLQAGFQQVMGLQKFVNERVDGSLLHLIQLRASILNGCAFCIDMHSREAAAAGEDSRRLFAVAAWQEGPFFDDRERSVLALTDAVTKLGPDGVPDEVWEPATKHFSDQELADLILAIAVINVWNRVSITNRTQPPKHV
ncbi:carboxymuconolactone decarboxylase family protein [Actinocatenispora sera]|uniref:carboxymuconolactone decarboxylase family protein n=1 Tax=Actinocatenispora sera TaxID=390989 RepID=UPI0033EB5BA6